MSHDATHDDHTQADATGGAEQSATGPRTFTEEFRVTGDALLSKVKALVREGNIRRIILKNDEGRTLVEIPLTLGVIGTALLPVWAAIGAIAALVANLTLTVVRVEDTATPEEEPPAETAA
ncbi:MAG: DUF4342 domain-containing protein [Trueperaceae bacterium]|nr:DUF4342 domain-containing protein [Trueperaceae bacterium]